MRKRPHELHEPQKAQREVHKLRRVQDAEEGRERVSRQKHTCQHQAQKGIENVDPHAPYLLPKFAALYGMPMEAIIGMGTKINPSITSVSTLVLFAVVPFNLLKGAIDSVLTFLLYKRISPILHRGDEKRRQRREAKAA